MIKTSAVIAIFAALVFPINQFAQAPSFTIQADHPIATVSPTLYGLMTEEINYSYDGGIYGELVRDRVIGRGFGSLTHWPMVARGNAQVSISSDETTGPSATLTRSLRVTVSKATANAPAGVENDGYWGIPVRPHSLLSGLVLGEDRLARRLRHRESRERSDRRGRRVDYGQWPQQRLEAVQLHAQN